MNNPWIMLNISEGYIYVSNITNKTLGLCLDCRVFHSLIHYVLQTVLCAALIPDQSSPAPPSLRPVSISGRFQQASPSTPILWLQETLCTRVHKHLLLNFFTWPKKDQFSQNFWMEALLSVPVFSLRHKRKGRPLPQSPLPVSSAGC